MITRDRVAIRFTIEYRFIRWLSFYSTISHNAYLILIKKTLKYIPIDEIIELEKANFRLRKLTFIKEMIIES